MTDTHCRIALLRFTSFAGKHDQPLFVCFQPFDVNPLSLLAQVSPSVIYDNTDSFRLLPTNTSGLELCQRETPTLAYPSVVAYGLRTDGRPEECQRADTKGSSFGLTSFTPPKLATRLVEPGANSPLPILTKMVGVQDCVCDRSEQVHYIIKE